MSHIHRAHTQRKQKPTRKEIHAFFTPICSLLAELKTGEVTIEQGHPVVSIHWTQSHGRADHLLDVVLGLITRVLPDQDIKPLKQLSLKLSYGILLTTQEVDRCCVLIKEIEDAFLKKTWAQLEQATQTEKIHVELSRLSLK